MAAADDAPDLSPFLGSPDDECPFCLEAMPPLTWRRQERTCFACCGKSMCPANTACNASVDNHQRKRLEELNVAISVGGQRNVADARKSYEQAVTCPNCRARLPTSKEEVFQYHLKNARGGRAYAQYNLAIKYENGTGTQKNLDEAARWFKTAAEQGDPWAMDACGQCFRMGKGVTQDLSEAKSWFERSAELQQPIGYYDLGLMYSDGIGVPKDEKEGFRLMRIAAELGLRVAECELGRLYATGKGVDTNLEEAIEWFLRSAEQGYTAAMTNAGIMLMGNAEQKHGNIVTTGNSPIPRAAYWYKKAAKLGDEEAARRLQGIRSGYSGHCAACNKRGAGIKFSRCARCKVIHYCSKECQIIHWKRGHKIDCVVQDP